MFLIRLRAAFLCVAMVQAVTSFANDPFLKFIPNKSQWRPGVQYQGRIPGGRIVVERSSLYFSFFDEKQLEDDHLQGHNLLPDAESCTFMRAHGVRLTFLNANAGVVPHSFGSSSEYYNYFLGVDTNRWSSRIHAVDGFVKPGFFPGIDLKVYASGQNLKYDYLVAPGANPGAIRWRYEGADCVTLDGNGNLVVNMSLGDIVEQEPLAYQVIDGNRIDVDVAYQIVKGEISFVFPRGYDSCHTLIIDPLLIFSTYSGSTADNWGSTATPGEHGTLYSAGVTNETGGGTFPATVGAFQVRTGGNYDIGILKYDSTGSQLLYASYLGGVFNESPHSLVVDKDNNLIVLGTTESSDFPTTAAAFDRTFGGGTSVNHVIPYSHGADIVISKFSPDGTVLLASTYVGGAQNDGVNHNAGGLVRNYGDQLRGDVITDSNANIIISTVTSSADFPSINAFDVSYNGGFSDAVVVKMNPTLSGIIWSTFLGGSQADASYSIKFDSQGNFYLAGGTASANFPVTANAAGKTFSGEVDGWIAHVSSDGQSLLHCTMLGTSRYDQVYFVDLNSRNDVYVYGQTNSSSFPISTGVYNNPKSGQFIQKYSADLAVRGFSTVVGAGIGIPDISPTAFLINDCDNIYLSGWGGQINSKQGFWNSSTNGLPISDDAIQKTSSGSDFYFMVLTDDAQSFLYGTYLGGNSSRTHVDGGTSRFDKAGVVYHAVCSGCAAYNATPGPTSDFPTTPRAWSRLNRSKNCNNAAFKFDLSSLKANIQTNNVKLKSPGISKVCMPDSIVFENVSIGGEIFKWDLGDGTKLTKTTHESVIHQYKSTGVYLVKLKALDAGTCREVDSTSTYVTVNKSASYAQPDDKVCEGSVYSIKAYGGVFYDWRSVTGTAMSKSAVFEVKPDTSTDYYVTITERNGCRKTDTVSINVVPAITPAFEFHRILNCFDRPELSVKNLTKDLQSSDITFIDFGDGSATDAVEAKHAYVQDGTYSVSVVASRDGCVFQETKQLPFYKISVPNVITPGLPDGKNDRFVVLFGEKGTSMPADFGFNASLNVYNRWGEPVFQRSDYRNDWGADGLAAGVYYYEVEIQDHGLCRSWLHVVK